MSDLMGDDEVMHFIENDQGVTGVDVLDHECGPAFHDGGQVDEEGLLLWNGYVVEDVDQEDDIQLCEAGGEVDAVIFFEGKDTFGFDLAEELMAVGDELVAYFDAIELGRLGEFGEQEKELSRAAAQVTHLIA